MAEATPKPWLVVFLVYIDYISEHGDEISLNNQLAKELDSMFQDIVNCDLHEGNCEIYVVYSSLNYELSSGPGPEAHKLCNTTALYKMRNNFPHDNTIHFVDHSDDEKEAPVFSKHNLQCYSAQKKEMLANIFKKIREDATDFYNCQVLLVTWDHGSGFGIFEVGNHETAEMVTWNELSKLKQYRYINQFINATPDKYKSSSKKLKSGKTFIIDNYLIPDHNFQISSAMKYLTVKEQPDVIKNVSVIKEGNDYFLKFDKIAGSADIEILSKIFPGSLNKVVESFAARTFYTKVQPEGMIEILTNEELAYSIKKGFGTVQVVLMMNCIMMNIHTAFALKDCVHYLVAPQNDISDPGYNYAEILEKINSGNVHAKDLAEICVTSSYKKNVSLRAGLGQAIDQWAIFSMHLQSPEFNNLITVINNIAVYFLNRSYRTDLKFLPFYATKGSYNFGGNKYLVDILNWIRYVEYINENGDVTQILYDLSEQHFSTTLQKIADKLLFRDQRHNYTNAYEGFEKYRGNQADPPNGLSIYLPAKLNTTEPGYVTFIAPARMQDQSWFIQKNKNWLDFLLTYQVHSFPHKSN